MSYVVACYAIELVKRVAISNYGNKRITIIIRPRRSRSAAAYSRQTFPWTICRSVRAFATASVGLSVQCIVENGGWDPDAVWHRIGRTGSGMRQVVGFGDRSTGRGTFGGEFGVRHCPKWPIGRTCATAPRRDPLPKLLRAGRLVIIIIILHLMRNIV